MFGKAVSAMKCDPADANKRAKLEQTYRVLLAGLILRDIDHEISQEKVVKNKKGIRRKAAE